MPLTFSMPILRNKNRNRWTVIDNSLLENTQLSWDARGLMAYLLSKPDGWNISTVHLGTQGNAGRGKLQRIMRELAKAGYLEYRTKRGKNGLLAGTEIIIHENPPRDRFSDSRKNGLSENPHLVSTETKLNTENNIRAFNGKNRKRSVAERALEAERRIADP